VWRVFTKAARDAGIGSLGTHTMRHGYRSWLDAVGTPMGRAAKAHASRFDHNHHEYLWGRGDKRDGSGPLENGTTRPPKELRGFQAGFIARKLLKLWRREWDSKPSFNVVLCS